MLKAVPKGTSEIIKKVMRKLPKLDALGCLDLYNEIWPGEYARVIS